MTENSIYSTTIMSKTGFPIPVFSDNKTVESRYDPVKDCTRTAQSINEQTKFLIITGIAGGILIKTILEQKPDIFIFAIENSQEDIDFLCELEIVRQIKENPRVCFCTCSPNEICSKLQNYYLPSFYGNLEILEQRGWVEKNKALIQNIYSNIQKALSIISADFSVQSHFGKLWQHNIMDNLQSLSLENSDKTSKLLASLPLNKTAIILAAGPTLDKTIKIIESKRNDYYLISTDTAFSVLTSKEIIPDAVVSIDGQSISNRHFTHTKKINLNQTLFLFDLCSNPCAIKNIQKSGGNICFFKSGHPFSDFICKQYKLSLPDLYSGSGTVTICATDFALKAGFNTIKVLGADFSYINGKAYTCGTYLDRIYSSVSYRLNTSEQQFDSLMCRTELEKLTNHSYTTALLKAYKTSFEDYLIQNKTTFIKKDDIYEIQNTSKSKLTYLLSTINIKELANQFFISSIEKKTYNSIIELENKEISLLPLISWYRFHDNKNKADFIYYLKKAFNYFEKYI